MLSVVSNYMERVVRHLFWLIVLGHWRHGMQSHVPFLSHRLSSANTRQREKLQCYATLKAYGHMRNSGGCDTFDNKQRKGVNLCVPYPSHRLQTANKIEDTVPRFSSWPDSKHTATKTCHNVMPPSQLTSRSEAAIRCSRQRTEKKG